MIGNYYVAEEKLSPFFKGPFGEVSGLDTNAIWHFFEIFDIRNDNA